MTRLGTTVTLIVVASVAVLGQTPTLRHAVRTAEGPGPFAGSVNSEVPAMKLGTVAAKSDLIIYGTPASAQSYLSKDERRVYTDYVINVFRAIGQRVVVPTSKPGVVAPLVVKEIGGTISLEGKEIRFVHEEVPPFRVGEDYIFFLIYKPQDDRYLLTAAEWGLFEVHHDKVTPTQAAKGHHRRYQGWSTAAFLAEVERLRATAQ